MARSPSVRGVRDPGDRVTMVGIAVNLLLLAAKVAVGFLIGSASLIADGVHSGSDVGTDLAVLGGMHLGRKRPDARHPYGHGRFETMAGALVAGALILVGAYIAWQGVHALYLGEHSFPGRWVIAVALVSILMKEWLYRWTARVARRLGSAALHANAWHHRSDALSSVAVVAGGIGGALGWGHADHLAGLLVGLMVVSAGGRTLIHVFHELSEGGLSKPEIDGIARAIDGVNGVRQWHQLRGRRVGRETFVDVHVLVDPALSVVAAHRVSMDVETAIRVACERPVNAVVHVEPELDELASHHED